MGTISFQEDTEPFEIMLQRAPMATAHDGVVIVTLPVYVPGLPEQTAEVFLHLTRQQAAYLQLQPALVAAGVQLHQQRR
jgi:hypothetical protein